MRLEDQGTDIVRQKKEHAAEHLSQRNHTSQTQETRTQQEREANELIHDA